MKKHFYAYPDSSSTNSTGIEVRVKKELRKEELFLLNQAGLDSYATLEAWTALGTNTQLSYATHGIFRYFGKFPSTIASHLINQYTNENDMVMDPMAGSGTTVLESLLLRRNCRSYDVNPLSILLAKVKVTKIDGKLLKKELSTIVKEYRPLSKNEFDWQPVGIKNIDHWFLPETQDSIRGIIYLIEQIKKQDVQNFFKICLASTIRPVSRATTQQGRLFLDIVTAKEDCLPTFIKKTEKSIDAVSNLPEATTKLIIDEHNAENTFDCGTSNDLIIIHPPYFNSYKYSSINSLELSWLKINHSDVRKNEVREFFKVGKAENVIRYLEDMRNTLNSAVLTLKPGGTIALMIGDTIIKNEYIRVTKLLIDRFIENNDTIKIEKIVLRIPKYTEASWTASQRRTRNKVGINLNDFIVIFRRRI